MKKGTIVLTPFPFTDLQSSKIRPAVIISSDLRKGDDVIIAFISSIVDDSRILETEMVLDITKKDFEDTGLKKSSVLKLDKIATIAKRIILGEIGSLNLRLVNEMNKKIKIVFDIK